MLSFNKTFHQNRHKGWKTCTGFRIISIPWIKYYCGGINKHDVNVHGIKNENGIAISNHRVAKK